MQKSVRLSWYRETPDEPTSRHLQKICNQGEEDQTVRDLYTEAYRNGLYIPARRALIERYPI